MISGVLGAWDAAALAVRNPFLSGPLAVARKARMFVAESVSCIEGAAVSGVGLWEVLAAQLAAAVSAQDVMDAVAGVAPSALGAGMVNISVLDESAQVLRLVRSRHTPDEVEEAFAVYSAVAPLPSTDALTTGRPVLLEDLADRDRRYPVLKDVMLDQRSFAVLPLIDGGRRLGVLGLGWPEAGAFDDERVRELERLAAVVAAALTRTELYAREQRSRERAERSTQRLRVMYDLSTQLAGATSEVEVARTVLDTVMPALGASAATITAYDGTTPARHLAATGLPMGAAEVRREHFEELPLVVDLVRHRQPVLIGSFADRARRYPGFPGDGVGQQSWANLPLTLGDRLVGVAAFGWDQPRDFSPGDRELLAALATHTALALDRAQLLQSSQSVAAMFQRALLPQQVTQINGWDIATLYQPAAVNAQVGGDWYDVFTVADGRTVLVIADVMGKGVPAAAIMSSARAALRTLACLDPDPVTVLTTLDRCMHSYDVPGIITCWYGLLDPATGRLTYSNAGHPPPLILTTDRTDRADRADHTDRPERTDRWLTDPVDLPLRALHDRPRHHGTTTIDACELLLLYTDGLVERRDHSIDAGLDQLSMAARAAIPDLHDHRPLDLTPAITALTHDLAQHTNPDDIAIVAARRRPDICKAPRRPSAATRTAAPPTG